MYFTVYKTTNLINGKIYVGVHKTEDLNDDYLGSGILLNRAIEKYGKENFSKDIIAICDTEEEMYKLEESLVCQAFLTFFSTYNLRLGGEGSFSFINKNKLNLKNHKSNFRTRAKNGNFSLSESHKKKISENKKLFYKKVEHPNLRFKWITNGTINRKVIKESILEVGWTFGRSKWK